MAKRMSVKTKRLIDEYGRLAEERRSLERKLREIKQEIESLGEGHKVGYEYEADLTWVERCYLDAQRAREILPPRFLHKIEAVSTYLRVTVRRKEEI